LCHLASCLTGARLLPLPWLPRSSRNPPGARLKFGTPKRRSARVVLSGLTPHAQVHTRVSAHSYKHHRQKHTYTERETHTHTSTHRYSSAHTHIHRGTWRRRVCVGKRLPLPLICGLSASCFMKWSLASLPFWHTRSCCLLPSSFPIRLQYVCVYAGVCACVACTSAFLGAVFTLVLSP